MGTVRKMSRRQGMENETQNFDGASDDRNHGRQNDDRSAFLRRAAWAAAALALGGGGFLWARYGAAVFVDALGVISSCF
jgi:hypothetical protein